MIERENIILGVISLLGGVYCLLLAYRIIPINPKNPEKSELWHKKFDSLMKLIGLAIIIGGIAQLLGLL